MKTGSALLFLSSVLPSEELSLKEKGEAHSLIIAK